MYRILILILFTPLLCFGSNLLNRSQISIGATGAYLEREKASGSRQDGIPVGARVIYERLKRYSWYWGVEGEILWGTLKGHAKENSTLKSHFRSYVVEGRFGYTFQKKEGSMFAFTPFVGGGYLEENSNFISPSPLKIKFKTEAPFATAGFLSWINLGCRFELGLNFKARLPIDPKCRIHNDPQNPSFNQLIGERVSYRIELPLSWSLTESGNCLLTFSPYWESRVYAGRINYPFDFIKTTLTFTGASLLFNFRF